MRVFARARALVRALFRSAALDRDLDRELDAWVDELAARHEAAGCSPAEARRRALAETGGVEQVKEQVRAIRPGHAFDGAWKDVVYAWRGLARSRGLLVAITLTLALGVGANAAVYSVAWALLVEPPPFRAPDRLTILWAELPSGGYARAPLSGPELDDFRRRSTRLTDVGGVWATTAALTGDGDPEQVRVGLVTTNFFDVLGVEAAIGRTFRAEEADAGPAAPVLLAWPTWQRRFGGDPGIVGRRILVDGGPAEVVGVLPAGLRLQFPPDAAVPDDLQAFRPFGRAPERGPRTLQYLRVVGRLAPGATFEDARQEIAAVSEQIRGEHATYAGTDHRFFLAPFLDERAREARPALTALVAGVVAVLLIACVNVSGLLLARAVTRRREVATQLALGASRGRLVRQFVVEGLLVSGLGAAAGLLTGMASLKAIVALRPAGLDRLAEATLNGPVMAAILGLAVVWGVLFALAPAAELRRLDVAAGLQHFTRVAGPLRYRARAALLVTQVALGLVLLVSAGLLVRTVAALQQVDLGFDRAAPALTFRVGLPPARYPWMRDVNAFHRALEEKVAALPGVTATGAVSHVPFDTVPNWSTRYETEATVGVPGAAREADARAVSPGTLATLGVTLADGRFFTEDDDTDVAPVVIVDDRLAARAWPGRSAVGQRLRVDFIIEQQFVDTWAEVVGVVRHVRHRSPDVEVREQVYVPFRQNLRNPMAYIVRTAGDPAALAGPVREAVREIDPHLPAYDVRPLAAYVSDAMSARRFSMTLAAVFAGVALALAAVGLAGLMAYAVASRTREIGVRLALGAAPRRIRAQVLGEASRLVAAGLLVGLAAAAAAAQGLAPLLYAVGPGDVVSYGIAIACLAAAGLAASWLPARRAMKVDPITALRAD